MSGQPALPGFGHRRGAVHGNACRIPLRWLIGLGNGLAPRISSVTNWPNLARCLRWPVRADRHQLAMSARDHPRRHAVRFARSRPATAPERSKPGHRRRKGDRVYTGGEHHRDFGPSSQPAGHTARLRRRGRAAASGHSRRRCGTSGSGVDRNPRFRPSGDEKRAAARRDGGCLSPGRRRRLIRSNWNARSASLLAGVTEVQP